MGLHRLSGITLGSPVVQESIEFYSDFGLQYLGEGRFASLDGGEQLRLVDTPKRRLVNYCVGVDDAEDLAVAAYQLRKLDLFSTRTSTELVAEDPASGLQVTLRIEPRVTQQAKERPQLYNGPGRSPRVGRSAGVVSEDRVRPRKLGHVFMGSVDHVRTMSFLTALGFICSDYVNEMGAFMRCSTDHHNILVLNAPLNYFHHSAWQVEDVDEVGRGAMRMLEGNPQRHVWGMGRHYVGSNFFWYLRDPAGNFSEYYADMDTIEEDQLWTPGEHDAAKTLYSWGQPPPPSFIAPEDLAELMTGSHE